MHPIVFRYLPAYLILLILLSACQTEQTVASYQSSPTPLISTASFTPSPNLTATWTATLTFTPLPTETPAGSPTETLTPTWTARPTRTSSNTPLPTQSVVRAKVLERANCRYGPGAVYLYKYGLVPDSNLNVIGRIESGDWVYLQAFGGNNPCWVKTSLLSITGDLGGVEVVYPGKAVLPQSPYYPPVDWVGASRNDALVTVAWNEVPLRAGDEEDDEMQHYIVEVWRCESGVVLFEALGTNSLSISFIDQYGCTQASHGRVYVQEKHGFAGPVEIPWP